MSSRLNTLLHGEAYKAAEILSGDTTPNRDEILLELRAALTNALNRIDKLEEKLDGHLVCHGEA